MGFYRTNRASLLGGAALWMIAFSGNSAAQEIPAAAPDSEIPETVLYDLPPDSAAIRLQLIVVGAGVEKVAIETPQAVTVLDQQAIDSEQAMTIGDLFREVPGVTITGSNRIAGQSFNIRGIGDLNSSDESKIIVTVDGATKFYEQYRVGSFFSEPELYKQVEILRGPASATLYGSGALGGVINFTTKDASDFLVDGEKLAVKVKGMYDSNKDGFMASGIVAGRINERTEYLVNGIFRRAADYITGDDILIEGSGFEASSGLAKIAHSFGQNEEQSVRLSYQLWNSDADDTQYSQTGTLGFGTIDREITDQTVVFRYENPASDNPYLDLNVNLSFSDIFVHQEDATSTIPSVLFDETDYAYRTWQGGIDNTFEYSFANTDGFLTVGTQISYQERIADAESGAIDFHPEGTDTKFGFFAQNEFVWNDRLTVVPGVRVDLINLSPDSSIPDASEQFEIAFSPKLAALYKINEYLSVFGSVAHTERAPTLDELFSTGANRTYPGGRFASLDLEKEQSNAVEAGFSVSLWDLARENDELQIKTTGFYNDLKDLIAPNPDTGQIYPVAYYVNIDEAEIYGVEVEAAYDARFVFASLAYSLIRGEDKETGETLSSIPADTLAMTVGGRIADHDLEFGWRGLFAAGMKTGTTDDGPFPGYGIHDVFANWTPQGGLLSGYELRASVENIFNRQYQNNLAGDPAPGRTFKLTMAKQFNW